MLLYASVQESELCLWSVEPGPNGAARRRVIDLDPLLPSFALSSFVEVVGFAEGAGAIFLRTDFGLFTVELSSSRSNKVHEDIFDDRIMLYESFYTGGTDQPPTVLSDMLTSTPLTNISVLALACVFSSTFPNAVFGCI
jgi:hypothetical protein